MGVREVLLFLPLVKYINICVFMPRRKIRLIESNAKCRYRNKLACKGTLRTKFTNTSGPVLKNHICVVPGAKMIRVVLSRNTTNRRYRWCTCLSRLFSECNISTPEAEFLDVIGTKQILKSFPLWYSQSPILNDPPFKQKWFVLYIVYGNLRSENSQDYSQKTQRKCMVMNSADQ
jgi:hypothetical protein